MSITKNGKGSSDMSRHFHLGLSFPLVVICFCLVVSCYPKTSNTLQVTNLPSTETASIQETSTINPTTTFPVATTKSIGAVQTALPSAALEFTVTPGSQDALEGELRSTFAGLSPGQYLIHTNSYSRNLLAWSLGDQADYKIISYGDQSPYTFPAQGRYLLRMDERHAWDPYDGKMLALFPQTTQPCGYPIISPDLVWGAVICDSNAQEVPGKVSLKVIHLASGRPVSLWEIDDESHKGFYGPIWSPDGHWLEVFYFVSGKIGSIETLYYDSPDAGLYFYDTSCFSTPDTCNRQRLGPYRPPVLPQFPVSWSPDSQSLFMVAGDIPGFINFRVNSQKWYSMGDTEDWSRSINYVLMAPDGGWLAVKTSENIHLLPTNSTSSSHVIDLEGEDVLLGWLTIPLHMETGLTYAITQEGAHLNLRVEPSLKSAIIESFKANDGITILDGPVTADGFHWWNVTSLSTGKDGWVVEQPNWFTLGDQ